MDRWVLACSLAGTAAAALAYGSAWAQGFALGAALSWMNLRLIRAGVDALGRAARAGSASRGRRAGRWRWWLGLALAASGLYGIFVVHWLPWRAVLAGLFAMFAGVFLFAIAELLRPATAPSTGLSPAPRAGADPETDSTAPEP